MGDMPAPVGEECTGDEDVDMRVDVAAATDGDPIRGARTATGEVGKPNPPPAADMVVVHDPEPDPDPGAAAVCSSGVVGDTVDEGDDPAEDLRRSCCVGCIREWLLAPPALSSSSVCQ
jgi:hypothetical protein